MRYRVALVGFVSALGMILAGTLGAAAQDANAVYQKRDDTMKELGRNFFGSIGRVVKGTVPFGPDTVTAATAVDTAARSLTPASFAPGSDVAASNMKPEATTQPDKVAKYLADLQVASAKLVAAANGGDKDAVAAAFQSAGQVCGACHKDFRKPLP